jgi:hypothetical protein
VVTDVQRLEIRVHFGTPQHVLTAQMKPAAQVLPTPEQPALEQRKSIPQKPPPVDSVQQKQLGLGLHAMKVAQLAPTQPGLGFDTLCAETGVTAPTIIGAT